MQQEQITDAIRRIDEVVTAYRSSDAGQSFKWVVKPQYRIKDEPLLAVLLMAFVISLIFRDDTDWFYGLVFLCAGMFFLYWAIPKYFKFFQEKKWSQDYISKTDILYLCEDENLKDHVIEMIRKNTSITYTELLERKEKIETSLKKKLKNDEIDSLIAEISKIKQ